MKRGRRSALLDLEQYCGFTPDLRHFDGLHDLEDLFYPFFLDQVIEGFAADILVLDVGKYGQWNIRLLDVCRLAVHDPLAEDSVEGIVLLAIPIQLENGPHIL